MKLENNNGLMSEINVTPFVDVMLVLLIIFMVTAPMMVQGVSLDLPKAVSSPIDSETEQLIVSIDKNNKIFINDYGVTLDFLKEKLGNILAGRTDRSVYLRADRVIPYGVVVQVMSEIKQAGAEKLAILTEPDESDPKNSEQSS
jgi:biopolymer transport protein TolR